MILCRSSSLRTAISILLHHRRRALHTSVPPKQDHHRPEPLTPMPLILRLPTNCLPMGISMWSAPTRDSLAYPPLAHDQDHHPSTLIHHALKTPHPTLRTTGLKHPAHKPDNSWPANIINERIGEPCDRRPPTAYLCPGAFHRIHLLCHLHIADDQ